MNKKNIFMLSLLLLTTNQINSGFSDDYFEKLFMFFWLELGGTFVHECGHMTASALVEGMSKIYIGVTEIQSKKTDGKFNLVTLNPTCGVTKSRIPVKTTRIKQCEIAMYGPLYGMLYFHTMYRIFGVLEHRFSPTLYNSLRLYCLVQLLKEFLYGAVPLSIGGDTKKIYTMSKLMSEKKYDSVAAKNFTAMKNYAHLCFFLNIAGKIAHKLSSDSVVAAFKRDYERFLFIYKITSSYALQYGLLGRGADSLMAGMKEKHHKTKKIPENAPSPFDYIGGLLVAPLII